MNVLVDLPCVCVVVNFLSHVIFVFLLFLGMVMYANEVETKETYKLPLDENLTTRYASQLLCALF